MNAVNTQAARSATTVDPYRLRPAQAIAAIRVLLRDPEDTAQVFTIVRALSGKTLLRGYNRFCTTPTGRAVLAESRALIDVLRNRDYLRSLPADSLGRAYLAFMEGENISADGLVEASSDADEAGSPGLTLYSCRLRDMHDLWHVTTGYGRDTMGEVCLLGFTFGQTRNPGLGFIALIGAVKIAREADPRIFRALWAGYRAGRRAAWLPAADWERLLGEPLESVRAALGVRPPRVYPEMRLTA
ncbi:MAG: Coq4 family protein [Pseudomonadales bacterium]